MARITRKFGGKLYHLEATAWSKREAQNRVKQFRRDGFLARIVKSRAGDQFSTTGEGWSIYTRVEHR